MLPGAGLFVTVSRPFVAKGVNKLKSIKKELGEEMGKSEQGEIISSLYICVCVYIYIYIYIYKI